MLLAIFSSSFLFNIPGFPPNILFIGEFSEEHCMTPRVSLLGPLGMPAFSHVTAFIKLSCGLSAPLSSGLGEILVSSGG